MAVDFLQDLKNLNYPVPCSAIHKEMKMFHWKSFVVTDQTENCEIFLPQTICIIWYCTVDVIYTEHGEGIFNMPAKHSYLYSFISFFVG